MKSVVDDLKSQGHKITKTRVYLLELLKAISSPVSVDEILKQFSEKGLKPNKTTIYREIEFLKQKDLVREIDLGERKSRYELQQGKHHHHVVCIECKGIEDVDLLNDLAEEENRIAKRKKFKIINHRLEFFGICSSCQKLI